MPHYYFHIRVSDIYYPDPDGAELTDMDTVRVEVVCDLHVLAKDMPPKASRRELCFSATDETGTVVPEEVLSLTFERLETSCSGA